MLWITAVVVTIISRGVQGQGKCTEYDFECTDGKCIPITYICDLVEDCDDGIDEANATCSHLCKKNEFRCPEGKCIKDLFVCDNLRDCKDGSDESKETCADCHVKFKCPSGECIPRAYVCDGRDDCPDGTDEKELHCLDKPCEPYEFRCLSGECLFKEWQCDGDKDCEDDSDEDEEVCEVPKVTILRIEEDSHYFVTIMCNVVGFPPPELSWKKDGEPYLDNTVMNTTQIHDRMHSVLTLPRTAFIYHRYTCVGKNNAGSAAKDITVLYKGDHPPVAVEQSLLTILDDLNEIEVELDIKEDNEETTPAK